LGSLYSRWRALPQYDQLYSQ